MRERVLSVSCIYNSPQEYLKMINSIIKKEKILDLTKDIEFLGVYNPSNSKFVSIRDAINYIIRTSKSKNIVIVHQDVEFLSDNPLTSLLEYLSIDNSGIIGTAGVDKNNKATGFIINGNAIWGDPFFEPQITDTVDELLFAFNKEKFKDFNFLKIKGWHGYSIEMCAYAKKIGLNNYSIPITVHHKSFGMNRRFLAYTLKMIEKNYKAVMPLHTTVGILGANSEVTRYDIKLRIKDVLNKHSLLPLIYFYDTELLIITLMIKVFPLLKKTKIFQKRKRSILPFLIGKETKNLIFFHIKNCNCDNFSIETRSLTNLRLVPKSGNVKHIYCSKEKISNLLENLKISENSQIILESTNNYDLKDIINSNILLKGYKIKISDSNIMLIERK